VVPQRVEQALEVPRILADGWLVHHQQRGPTGEHPGHGEAALLPEGEGPRVAVPQRPEPEALEERAAPLPGQLVADPALEELPIRVLKHQRSAGEAPPAAQPVDGPTVHSHLPRGGTAQPGGELAQGGLARAVVPHHQGRLALVDDELHAPEHRRLAPVGEGEPLRRGEGRGPGGGRRQESGRRGIRCAQPQDAMGQREHQVVPVLGHHHGQALGGERGQ